MSSIPAWTNNLTNQRIKSDMVSISQDGLMTYTETLGLLEDIKTDITSSGSLQADQFNDLQTIVANDTNGLTTSNYVQSIFSKFVLGDPGNAYYTGGMMYLSNWLYGTYSNPLIPSTSTVPSLGNLAVGYTADNFNKLEGKLFLGNDRPDPSAQTAPIITYKPIDQPLYNSQTKAPSINDVSQGSAGDCYLIASLGSVVYSNATFLKSGIVDNGNNSYGVRFYVNGAESWVTVDNYLPYYPDRLVFAGQRATVTSSWVELYEKGFAQLCASYDIYAGGTGQSKTENSYSIIAHEGSCVTGLSCLIGSATDISYHVDPTIVKTAVISALNEKNAVTLVSYVDTYDSGNNKQNMVSRHDFSVLGYDQSTDTIQLRNPYGIDTYDTTQNYNTTFSVSWTSLANWINSSSVDFIVGAIPTTGYAIPAALPTITPISNPSPNFNQTTTNISDLFQISDSSSLQEVQISTTSTIQLNGATNLSQTSNTYLVSFSDFQKIKYQFSNNTTNDTNSTISISVFNGTDWSDASNITLTNKAVRLPTLNQTSTPSLTINSSINLSTIFNATLNENADSITQYRITVSDPSHMVTNGATNLSATPGTYQIYASDLSKISYTGFNASTSDINDTLSIQALNGYGIWTPATNLSITNKGLRVPTLSNKDSSTKTANSTIALSNLVNSTVIESGDSITHYKLVNTGNAVVNLNGATNLSNAANTYQFSAQDFSKVSLTFKNTSTASTTLGFNLSVLDTYGVWSDATTFSYGVGNVNAPTVSSKGVQTLAIGSSVSVASLFNISLNDVGDAVSKVRISSGLDAIFMNGAVNTSPSNSYIEVSGSDFSKLLYTGINATVNAKSDHITIDVFDTYGNDSSTNTTINTTGKITNAPNVSVISSPTIDIGTNVSIASLLNISLNDNTDKISKVRIYAPLDTIYPNGASITASGSNWIEVSGTDFAKVNYTGQNTSTQTVARTLSVDVFDTYGKDTSATLTINVSAYVPPPPPVDPDVAFVATLSGKTLKNADPGSFSETQTSLLSAGQINSMSGEQLGSVKARSISAQAAAGLNTKTIAYIDVNSLNTDAKQALNSNILNNAISVDALSSLAQYLTPNQMKQISPKTLAAMKGQIPLSTDQASVLSGSQVAMLDVAAIGDANISAIKMSNFTTTQIPSLNISALTTAQIGCISKTQWGALTTEQIKNISNDQAIAVNASAIKNMTTTAIGTFVGAHVNALTSTQLIAIPTTAISALSVETISQISADLIPYMTVQELKSLTKAQLAVIQQNQLQNLTTSQGAQLTADIINAFNKDQITGLTTDVVRVLNNNVIKSLTTASITAFSADQYGAMKGSAIQAINVTSLNSLSPDVLQNLSTTVISQLSNNQLQNLSSTAYAGFSNNQVQSLTTAQVRGMSTSLAKLSADAIRSLSTDQVKVIQNNQLQALASEHIVSLTNEQISTGLTANQIKAFGASFKYFQASQITQLTSDQVKNLATNEIQVLNSEQIQALRNQEAMLQDAQLKALTSTQIGQLSADFLSNMTSKQLNALASESHHLTNDALNSITNENIGKLSASFFNSLTTEEFAGFSGEKLQNISTQNIRGLSATVLNAINLNQLTSDQLKNLQSGSIQGLTSDALNALNSDSINAIGVKNLSTTQAKSLSSNYINSLTSTSIKLLTAPLIGSLTTDCIAALQPNLGLLSGSQLSAISEKAAAVLTADALNSVGKGINNLPVAKIGTDVLNSLSQTEIQMISNPTIASLDASKFKSLDGFVDAMSANQLSNLGQKQFQNVSGNALNSLSSSQIKSIGGGLLSVMTTGQLQSAGSFISSLSKNQRASFTSSQLAILAAS